VRREPATDDLTRYPVRVDAGRIFVGPREDER